MVIIIHNFGGESYHFFEALGNRHRAECREDWICSTKPPVLADESAGQFAGDKGDYCTNPILRGILTNACRLLPIAYFHAGNRPRPVEY